MKKEQRQIEHAFCAHCDAHINKAIGCTYHSEPSLSFLVCPYCYEFNLLIGGLLQKVDEQHIFDLNPRLLFTLKKFQQKARDENQHGASYLMKPSACPTCQHTLTGAATLTGTKPLVGDFAICCSCSALNQFDEDFNLVSANDQTVLDAIEDKEDAQKFLYHLKQQQQHVRDHNALRHNDIHHNVPHHNEPHLERQNKSELEPALNELFQHIFGDRK